MKTSLVSFVTLGLLSGGLIAAQTQTAPVNKPEPPGFHTLQIGDAAPDFSLPGVDGKTYRLADFQTSPFLMVVFLCNHCPVSHAAETRLIPFVAKMKGTGLAVVAINPNNDEGLQIDELGYSKYGENFEGSKAYARDSGFNFPYLYDGDTQETAKAYGCLCTPHVFIFDQTRHLRYKGRFDDSDLVDPASVHSSDATAAVQALLAGRPVSAPETRPIGCSTKWRMLKTAVTQFNEDWKKLPVTVEPIDDDAVAALTRNPTRKLRVINLWATWCGPCVEEFPSLVTVEMRLMRRDFELITISKDDPKTRAKVLQFLQKQHAALPPLDRPSVGKEGRTTNNYIYAGAGNDALARALDPQWPGPLPYTIAIAPGGEILARWSGAVDPAEFQNKLLDILGAYRHRSQL